MKILAICQYYYPEPVRFNDICEELKKSGHEVDVITGVPNYPMGNIYEGYKNEAVKKEVINGINVTRIFTLPRKKNVIGRLLNYLSFSISSSIYVAFMKKEYDMVLVNQLSPVMMIAPGIKYKKKFKKKLVTYCLDIWPESLKVGGIKENSNIFKIFNRISKKMYINCDKILISSKSFKKYLVENFGISESKIKYLPQYAENIFERHHLDEMKSKETYDFLFAGNIGTAQSMDTIIEAAYKMRENKKLYWHIVGNGSELERLKQKVIDLKLENVVFYGRKNVDEMPKFYEMADAMLLTLNGTSGISNTLPGKVQSYMAAGKPIIASINGDACEVINEAKCGFCGKADNSDELVENINKFIECNNKKELGENAYKYYINNFSKDKFMEKLLSEIMI